MTAPSIVSAHWASADQSLVRLTFSDGTTFAIYPNDGSADTYADRLLKDWLEAGNEISVD